MPRAPINHLAHAVRVPDPQIVFSADGKDGFKNSGKRLIRTEFHLQADGDKTQLGFKAHKNAVIAEKNYLARENQVKPKNNPSTFGYVGE